MNGRRGLRADRRFGSIRRRVGDGVTCLWRGFGWDFDDGIWFLLTLLFEQRVDRTPDFFDTGLELAEGRRVVFELFVAEFFERGEREE